MTSAAFSYKVNVRPSAPGYVFTTNFANFIKKLFILTFLFFPSFSNKVGMEDRSRGKVVALTSQLEVNSKRKQINFNETALQDLHIRPRLSFAQASEFLECVQHCAPLVKSVNIGRGGGFGSMFQFAAKEFLDMYIIASNYKRALKIRFKGNFKWYTKNSGCGRKGFRCFFKTETILSTKEKGDCKKKKAACSSEIPVAKNIFWWGVVQAYMFRPNKLLLSAADSLREQSNFVGFPDIALHIRTGDKKNDPKSRQNIEISPQTYLELAERWAEGIIDSTSRRVLVYIATDSGEVQKLVDDWAQLHLGTMQVIMQVSKVTGKSKNYRGRSNEAAKVGMHISNSDKFLEAQKFIVDLHFMMHARYFGGLCMSQPARIVVNIGFTRGILIQAVALDEQNIELVDRWKFGKSEGWSKLSDIL